MTSPPRSPPSSLRRPLAREHGSADSEVLRSARSALSEDPCLHPECLRVTARVRVHPSPFQVGVNLLAVQDPRRKEVVQGGKEGEMKAAGCGVK